MTDLDLTTISDEIINKEYWRRIHARRSLNWGTGRKKVFRPCPKCGEPFSGREIKAHTVRCTVKLKSSNHQWLVDRGWSKAGENRMGMITQVLWSHPRFEGRSFTTENAMAAETKENSGEAQ